jgi:hypothetical protein
MMKVAKKTRLAVICLRLELGDSHDGEQVDRCWEGRGMSAPARGLCGSKARAACTRGNAMTGNFSANQKLSGIRENSDK